jgi:ABC-type branched-subunit amino acid transport system substrate-binding protein
MVNQRSRSIRALVLILAVIAGLMATPGHAQKQEGIPEIPNAELLFEEGVSAFERGEYKTSYERFQLVSEYELNQKTTAALLMGGKALIRLGRYQDAVDRLKTLISQYPETGYREEATSLIKRAWRLQEATQAPDTLRIGVTLPMGSAWVSQSQALFNGLRLAVEEHNSLRRRYVRPRGLRASADTFEVYDTADARGDSLAAADGETTVATPTDTARVDSLRIVTEQVERPEWVAKMHFRRTGAKPKTARAAVDSLVRIDEVDVIIGPIRSETARPAGARAEDARVPLVAPVATDASVSAGRDYVFQANPTISTRGRIMARFAKNGLLMDRVGVIYERGNDRSARMAEGFRREARRQDLAVPLPIPLQDSRDWSRLPTLIEKDSTITDSLLALPEAFYLPVIGQGAVGKIQDALTGMRQAVPEKRVLGNAEWHDLPFANVASAVTATYTNGFYVQTSRPAVQRFVRRYRLLTDTTPDELSPDGRRLAYAGYDVAHFLLSVLSPSAAPLDPQTLRAASTYEGLGVRVDFRGENTNQAMFIHRYRKQRIELLR